MAATTTLREALNVGISSGNLMDTKFILYSHRDSSGRVYKPKALYASSHVLKTVPYFNDLLFGNFAESQLKDLNEKLDGEESAEDYEYLSDSDLEDDEDEKPSSGRRAAKSKINPSKSPAIPSEAKIACEEHDERVRKGKIVKLPDMAFVTFQAFLVYLYTGVIEFAPFGSDKDRRSRSAEIVNPSDDKIPRPSPKSVYRLADKYDVPALKTLALNRIRGGLGGCDIIEEAFSKFASQYDEIRSLYVDQLAYIWARDTTGETRTSVEKKVDGFVEGDLEHATETFFALLEVVNREDDIQAPASISLTATQITSPANWGSVNAALIKSIRTGVFFDRKYWARHYKGRDVSRPVYFSSTVMNDMARQLDRLVKYLEGGNHSDGTDGDANAESDCEEGSPTVEDEPSKAGESKEEQTRAVLTTGSFSAWKSLFFYLCTEEISFAPLKSQGADYRSNYIREKTVAAAPPPCSPKSIHALANLLEIKPLCDSAFADIKGKVTMDNVVGEIFSWVADGQEEVVDIQWDLLISNFKDSKTIALVKENMRRISNGSSPHCAATLKLGLRKAFDLKTGVRLRCSYSRCIWYTDRVSYSSVGKDTAFCQMCRNRDWGDRYFQCVGCGSNRTGAHALCKSCGKRFL